MPPAVTTAASRVPNTGGFVGLTEPVLFRLSLISAAICLLAGAGRAWSGQVWRFDFFGIWSFARYAAVHAGSIGGIYNPARLQQFQTALAPGLPSLFPFPYPPSFLWLTVWAGTLPFRLAWLLWTAAGIVALAAALAVLFTPPWRRCAMLLPFIGVASLQNVMNGETGFFTGALLIAGFALLPRRPFVAGLMFGLLTAKPQLGVLIPFVLLSLGAWRAIAGAGTAALALAAASCLAFGPHMWLDWWRCLPAYDAMVTSNEGHLAPLMVTVPAALSGLPPVAAWGLYGMTASAVIGLVCTAFRRARPPPRLAAALALAGIPLAAPHCLRYDTPALYAGMLLAAECLVSRRGRVPVAWLALFAWMGWGQPAFIDLVPVYPATVLSELLLFAAIARLGWRG
jgi:hypothetical protein